MALGPEVERPEPKPPEPPVKPQWDSEAAWIKSNPRPEPSRGAAVLKLWDDARREFVTKTLPKYKADKAAYDKYLLDKSQPPRIQSKGTKGQILDPNTGEPIKFGDVPQSGSATKSWTGFPAQTAALLQGMQAASVAGSLPYGNRGTQTPARYVPRTDAEIHRAAIDEEIRNASVARRMNDQMRADSEFKTKFLTDMEVEGERRRAANIANILRESPPPRAVYNPVRAAQTMPSYEPRPLPSEQEMLAKYAPRPMPSEEEMLAKYAPRQQPSEEELLRRYAVQDALRNY